MLKVPGLPDDAAAAGAPVPALPFDSVGLSLPLPISARIDLLVALCEQKGERTSRKEIVATCILGAPDGAEELVRWLRLYRRSPARPQSPCTRAGSRLEELELRPARPGPRPRPWRNRSPTASA